MIDHTGWSLLSLYIANVVAAFAIFADALLLVILLPFQTVAFPAGIGPTWIYSSGILLVLFQYYVWALEIADYWFEPDADKYYIFLAKKDQWLTNTIVWGSVFTATTGGIFSGFADNYLVSKGLQAFVATSFASQNWLFMGYIYAVEAYFKKVARDM